MTGVCETRKGYWAVDASLQHIEAGIFASDLHLFTSRSSELPCLSRFPRVGAAHQCVVLGGDVFDFRWSRHKSMEATLDAALAWLERLLASVGDSHVVYLPGNHDSDPALLARLEELAAMHPRFCWRQHWLQLGDCLFLHGDILEAKGCERTLHSYRAQFHAERPRPAWMHRGYDLVVTARMHRWIPQVRHRPMATCKRLGQIVRQLPLPAPDAVRRIYFGHTHVPLEGLSVEGFRFFNPGAGFRHMQWQPCAFEV
ncbi:MAG: hypothetical protein D6753_14910 [Planctomycetota bacterium]|nr:MAG: hypothetical protein D6753_14910 [Planctomycetota bacterium]